MFDISNVEITPKQLKQKLDSGESIAILDVREPKEVAICHLPNSIHIPIGQLQERLVELDKHKKNTIVVYCHLGGRSMQCVRFMRQHGFQALNLTGGTEAWAQEVDLNMARY